MSSDIYSTQDISHELIGFFSWFTPLQIVAVALRFYARSLTDYPLGLDDWLIVSSLIGQLAAVGIGIGGINYAGFGRHIGFLVITSPETLTTSYKYSLVANIWYSVVITLPKLSICVLYRRLFPQPAIVAAIWATVTMIVASSAGSIVTRLKACRPFATNWGSLDEQRNHCIDRLAMYMWSSFPNIITDVIMLALPLFVVWRLQMSLRHKVGLTVTFVIGSSGLVVSITRFLELLKYNGYLDSTFCIGRQFILTVMEPGIYLLSACLITYRPVLDKLSNGVGRLRRIDSIGGLRLREAADAQNQPPSTPDRGKAAAHTREGSFGDATDNGSAEEGLGQHVVDEAGDRAVKSRIQTYWEMV
ncbi:hypothetical protein B0T19DRAFT_482896 [Cercophora scortea]|uniref:Rhodopsin domain-containing protein n=1 Tax=Cercophora scortea TaxID=314031 RepID=A0AAE0MHD3_9PEZI|nr:hypothetical protein B0T19DRAFT_482896 [Cercophora scortea]